jgi:hypothetical protein
VLVEPIGDIRAIGVVVFSVLSSPNRCAMRSKRARISARRPALVTPAVSTEMRLPGALISVICSNNRF